MTSDTRVQEADQQTAGSTAIAHLPSSFCGTDGPLAASCLALPPASCCGGGSGDAVVPLPIAADVGVGTRCNDPCPPPRLVLPRGRPRLVPRGW